MTILLILNVHHMKRNFLIFLSLFVFSNFNLYAQSEWIGKWQTEPIAEGTEKAIMEYFFKNDSLMTLTFYSDNQISGVGRCVSEISMDGRYSKIGPLFIYSLNQESLNANLLKYETNGSNLPSSEKQIIKLIKNMVKPMFADLENVAMLYVTHDSPDTISFIVGDENNAKELEFHRPMMTIEQLFGLDEETNIDYFGETSETDDDSDLLDLYDPSSSSMTSSPMVKMWKAFGFFILYLILAFALIVGVKLMFAKHISRTNSAQKSVNVRRFYSVVRFVLRIVVIIVGLVLWVILLYHGIQVSKYIAILIMCSGGGLLLNLLSSLSLPMNFMTMKKFMSRERVFILYLRGFITDDYSPELEKTADTVTNAAPWKSKIDTDKENEKPNDFPLSEKSLAKAWNNCPVRDCEVFSVGLPEELESPEGTKRIYLENDRWQEDAKTLMELSKYILVCIHPNDNCIWEIIQCNTLFPEKTIYYVDNITYLGIVREKMGDKLPVCLKSKEIDHNHMMVYQKNGEIVVNPYSNTDQGLSNAVNAFFN